MPVTIYHNPRCSKSRRALALLRERGIEPEIVEYLVTPPTAAQLGRIVDRLRTEPRALVRRNEAPYAALALDDPGKSRDELLEAMAANPILIERPIVLTADAAALGRPPENVLTIL